MRYLSPRNPRLFPPPGPPPPPNDGGEDGDDEENDEGDGGNEEGGDRRVHDPIRPPPDMNIEDDQQPDEGDDGGPPDGGNGGGGPPPGGDDNDDDDNLPPPPPDVSVIMEQPNVFEEMISPAVRPTVESVTRPLITMSENSMIVPTNVTKNGDTFTRPSLSEAMQLPVNETIIQPSETKKFMAPNQITMDGMIVHKHKSKRLMYCPKCRQEIPANDNKKFVEHYANCFTDIPKSSSLTIEIPKPVEIDEKIVKHGTKIDEKIEPSTPPDHYRIGGKLIHKDEVLFDVEEPEELDVTCDICNRHFVSLVEYSRHIDEHIDDYVNLIIDKLNKKPKSLLSQTTFYRKMTKESYSEGRDREIISKLVDLVNRYGDDFHKYVSDSDIQYIVDNAPNFLISLFTFLLRYGVRDFLNIVRTVFKV